MRAKENDSLAIGAERRLVHRASLLEAVASANGNTGPLPALRSLSFVRSWTGINPAIDRAPILVEAPGLPGLFNAVSANGYTLGPIIGRITADAVRGQAVDPHYRLERFG